MVSARGLAVLIRGLPVSIHGSVVSFAWNIHIAEENDISIMEAERLIPQEVVIDFLVDELGEGSRRYGEMMMEPDPALMRKILLEIEADADK